MAAGERTLRSLAASHLRLWAGAIVVSVVLGTTGYVVLAGWSAGDALYMTIITLTTVGFREVRELDGTGRAWTMILAVTGVGIIFGTVGIVAEAVLAEFASGRREQRRMSRDIERLEGHFILCGFGRVGSTVARELRAAGAQLVVIDPEPSSGARARAMGCLVIDGDATDDEVLRQAGIGRARGLIATIDSDAQNVYVLLSARALNPDIFLVGRASADEAVAKLVQAGADRVVSPYKMAGRRLAELAVRPRVADFIDAALSHGELAFALEEVKVEPGSSLEGRSVGALREEGVHLLAIVHGKGDYEVNPETDRRLAAGEELIVSGSAESVQRLRDAG